MAERYLVVENPVASTMVSSTRSVPSVVSTPLEVIRSMASVTSSTFDRL